MPRPKTQDILAAIADLKASIDVRLGGIDGRLGGIDVRLDGIDGRLDKHDDHFTRLDLAILRLDGKVDRFDERLTTRIDSFQEDMRGGFDALGGRMLNLEQDFTAMKEGLRRLERERQG